MKAESSSAGKRTPANELSAKRSPKAGHAKFYCGRLIYRTTKMRPKQRGYATDKLMTVLRVSCPECHHLHTVMQQPDGSLTIRCPEIQTATEKTGTIFSIRKEDYAPSDLQRIAYHVVELYNPNGVLERRMTEYIPVEQLGLPLDIANSGTRDTQ